MYQDVTIYFIHSYDVTTHQFENNNSVLIEQQPIHLLLKCGFYCCEPMGGAVS